MPLLLLLLARPPAGIVAAVAVREHAADAATAGLLPAEGAMGMPGCCAATAASTPFMLMPEGTTIVPKANIPAAIVVDERAAAVATGATFSVANSVAERPLVAAAAARVVEAAGTPTAAAAAVRSVVAAAAAMPAVSTAEAPGAPPAVATAAEEEAEEEKDGGGGCSTIAAAFAAVATAAAAAAAAAAIIASVPEPEPAPAPLRTTDVLRGFRLVLSPGLRTRCL